MTRAVLLLLDLTKPFLSALVLLTTAAGLFVAPGGPPSLGRTLATLVGTALVIGAANALNCWIERDVDALMERTRDRPLPAGTLAPRDALVFALATAVVGLVVLAAFVNVLATALAAIALVSYVAVYTPLKRRTPFCTLIGAIPGAIPPAIGWVAVTNRLDQGAWVLVAILLLWQPAHFLAISWIYRDDYARAGMPMLPVLYPTGPFVGRQIFLWSLALIPVSLLLAPVTNAGTITSVGAGLLSAAMATVALPGALRTQTVAGARRTFFASIAYMFLLLILLFADSVLSGSARAELIRLSLG